MSRTQRLTVVLVLNLILVAGLVTVGIGAHSLAVLAEAVLSPGPVGVGVALLRSACQHAQPAVHGPKATQTRPALPR